MTTIQGVRAYDPGSAQWTTPDAYAGVVSDPMSQQSYMWNDNNPIGYSDPTGYNPVSDFAGWVWNLIIGNDINTLRPPTASMTSKILAGVDISLTVIPEGKGIESAGKIAYSLSKHVLVRMAERNISVDMIKNALQDGVKMAGKNPDTTMHILRGAGPEGRDLMVITGDLSKKVVTAIDMDTKELEKEIMKATRIPQIR